MRLVLDTNVIVSGLLWSGAPRELVKAGLNDVAFFTSLPMLVELSEVLSRSKFQRRIAASQLTIEGLVTCYASMARLVQPAALPRTAPIRTTMW